MIRTCPLMGCTYSRLGATLGSPKLRLLSLLSHFCPLSPLYSPCSQGSYLSTCPSSPAYCCVPRPFQLLGGFVPHLCCPFLCLLEPKRAAPLSDNGHATPFTSNSTAPATHVVLLHGASTLAVTSDVTS